MSGTDDPRGGSTNGERATTSTTDAPRGTATGEEGGRGPGSHVCDVAFCPIGLALSAVQPLRPDVVEHLLLAGRELLLAARAVIDARVGETDEGGAAPTLERIDIG